MSPYSAPNPAKRKSVIVAAAATAAVSALLVPGTVVCAAWSVYDKTIPDLESAYTNHDTTAVDVVQQYLDRIATYNKGGGGGGTLGTGGHGINAVAQVSPTALSDAAAIQTLINSGATTAQYPLLGVPVIVKNSYDAAGLTTTNGVSVLNGSGTAGSTTLIPTTDAFSVAQLKAAGAIIIGKTNLSTMAYSFDGIDNSGGVVENPYNPVRQPGGSSSGTGAGIASQFAMLGMGGETGGSIRVPSSYNDLVGLKTSAGLIDPGGTWPLTPSRDVVGPIAKSVTDIAYAMNALVKPSTSNLFAGTAYYPTTGAQPGSIGTGLGEGTDPTSKGLTAVTGTRPVDYTAFLNTHALEGKTIAVENDIIPFVSGTTPTGAFDGTINTGVYANFQAALNVLRAQGATIKFVDLPATVEYYNTLGKSPATTTGLNDGNGNPIPYPTTTVGGTTPSSVWSSNAAAFYYEKEIESYHDPVIHNLNDFATALMNGRNGASGSTFSTLNSAYTNILALATIYNNGAAAGFGDANNDGIPDNPDAQKALAAFTTMREQLFDDFMTAQGIDAFVAPTMGSIAPYVTSSLRPAGTPTDAFSNGTASLIGRFEGNILGLPALAVPDGFVQDGSPVGIPTSMQFFGRLDSEASLIGYGYDYEQASMMRVDPDLSFVPEPASLGLLVLAAGVFIRRRPARRLSSVLS